MIGRELHCLSCRQISVLLASGTVPIITASGMCRAARIRVSSAVYATRKSSGIAKRRFQRPDVLEVAFAYKDRSAMGLGGHVDLRWLHRGSADKATDAVLIARCSANSCPSPTKSSVPTRRGLAFILTRLGTLGVQ